MTRNKFRMLQAAFGAKACGTHIAAAVAPDAPVEMSKPPGAPRVIGHGTQIFCPTAFRDSRRGLTEVQPVGKGLRAFAVGGQFRAAGLSQHDHLVALELVPFIEFLKPPFLTPSDQNAVSCRRIAAGNRQQQLEGWVAGGSLPPGLQFGQVVFREEPWKEMAVHGFVSHEPFHGVFFEKFSDLYVHAIQSYRAASVSVSAPEGTSGTASNEGAGPRLRIRLVKSRTTSANLGPSAAEIHSSLRRSGSQPAKRSRPSTNLTRFRVM